MTNQTCFDVVLALIFSVSPINDVTRVSGYKMADVHNLGLKSFYCIKSFILKILILHFRLRTLLRLQKLGEVSKKFLKLRHIVKFKIQISRY